MLEYAKQVFPGDVRTQDVATLYLAYYSLPLDVIIFFIRIWKAGHLWLGAAVRATVCRMFTRQTLDEDSLIKELLLSYHSINFIIERWVKGE